MTFLQDFDSDHPYPATPLPVTPCPTAIPDEPETPRPYVPSQDPNIPPKDISEKAKMRMLKLKLLEEEQKLQEAEELLMTEVRLCTSSQQLVIY